MKQNNRIHFVHTEASINRKKSIQTCLKDGMFQEFRRGGCRITAPPCRECYELSDMKYPIWIIRYGLTDMDYPSMQNEGGAGKGWSCLFQLMEALVHGIDLCI